MIVKYPHKILEELRRLDKRIKELEERNGTDHSSLNKNISLLLEGQKQLLSRKEIIEALKEKESTEEVLSSATLEIDYTYEPVVKINGEEVSEFKNKEVFFARFVRLAVARKVNERKREGRIYKYDDKEKLKFFNLYVGGFLQKDKRLRDEQNRRKKRDREIYELRQFLKHCEINELKKEIRKKLIKGDEKKRAEVQLIFSPDNIEINIDNLKKFKSNLKAVQTDKYETPPSKIVEQLIKDACTAYTSNLQCNKNQHSS